MNKSEATASLSGQLEKILGEIESSALLPDSGQDWRMKYDCDVSRLVAALRVYQKHMPDLRGNSYSSYWLDWMDEIEAEVLAALRGQAAPADAEGRGEK